METGTRLRLFAHMALASTAAAVALTATPASAASITINVAPNRMPQGASCVYVTDLVTGSTANQGGGVRFTAGRSVSIRINIEPGDVVAFEWHSGNCGPRLRDDLLRAPSPLPTVWNIN
jgi:hypothetical protein